MYDNKAPIEIFANTCIRVIEKRETGVQVCIAVNCRKGAF